MPTSGTFWTKVPSVLPGFRPSFLNSSSRYLTVSSSPLVPGARPSNWSADIALMRSSTGAASNFGIVVIAGSFEVALAGAAPGGFDAGVVAAGAGGSDFEQATAKTSRADTKSERFMGPLGCGGRAGGSTRSELPIHVEQRGRVVAGHLELGDDLTGGLL